MPRVFINPGHDIKYDPGACGNGLEEAKVALDISNIVIRMLEDNDYEVRSLQSDNLYYDSEYPDRDVPVVEDANDWEADIFVSIHCNAFANSAANGAEVLYHPNSADGKELAELIQERLVDSLDLTDRGAKERPDLIVLNHTDMPAVLVETAFISNPDDAELLRDKKEVFASCIVGGILEYFGEDETVNHEDYKEEAVVSVPAEKEPEPEPEKPKEYGNAVSVANMQKEADEHYASQEKKESSSVKITEEEEPPAPKYKIMDTYELSKHVADTLMATGVEGAFGSIAKSSQQDKPSIGCSQWLADRADNLLAKIPGGKKFIGKSYSYLEDNDLLDELSEVLETPEAQEVQLEQLAEDCVTYVRAVQAVPYMDDTRCAIYAASWCTVSYIWVAGFLNSIQDDGVNVRSLKELAEAFSDGFLDYCSLNDRYREGYSNRAWNVYYHVAAIDLTTDYGIPIYGEGPFGR